MPEWLDTALVFAAVGGALLYFVIRRLRRGRSTPECGSCCSAGSRHERIGAAALTSQARNKLNRELDQLSNVKRNQK